MSDRQRHGFVLLLVAGLIAASLAVIATQKTVLGLDLKGGVQLVYQAKPTPQSKVNQTSLNRAVDIMRQRVDQLGVSQPEIQTSGGSQITVGLPNVTNVQRAENEVGTTSRLFFYDWEANALTPNGKPVAGQLNAQEPNAVTISQGGAGGPGLPGGGGVPLYQAVKLASQQPVVPTNGPLRLSRTGPLYYVFGAPGSSACATVARLNHTTPVQGQHCLLAGPDSSQSSLASDLPSGVSISQGQTLAVPQGTVVLQAANPSASNQIKADSPTAQFYVLKDNLALTGADITNPQASTDQSGSPDVTFGFNSFGAKQFQKVTAAIAHRGQVASPVGAANKQVQHFAVALGGGGLNTQLISVPSIDFQTYPDGITGGSGADITGGFTSQTASDLANLLRLGALPINLVRISESQVSATLGAQALHQGLIAGAAGLAVVAMFLIFYYRLLGLIATSALIVYAMYFYALIKLIPITLTLPGIAGLILTIGVAADANIVIFERVKEEIRAGRSIRAGIATGYKKGLTAIIDANVVTIMTAFILFVLATAEVQGFAFTLGHRHDRVPVHGRAGHAGDPDVDGRFARDRAALGTGCRQAQAVVALRLHGILEVLLLAVGGDPADRSAGDRRARPESGDRLHLGNPHHRLAAEARHRVAGQLGGLGRGSDHSAGAEGLQQGAGLRGVPDLGQEARAQWRSQGALRAPEPVRARSPAGRDLGRADVWEDDRQCRGGGDHRVVVGDLGVCGVAL